MIKRDGRNLNLVKLRRNVPHWIQRINYILEKANQKLHLLPVLYQNRQVRQRYPNHSITKHSGTYPSPDQISCRVPHRGFRDRAIQMELRHLL